MIPETESVVTTWDVSDDTFANEVNEAMDKLNTDPETEIDKASVVHEGAIGVDNLRSFIPTFDVTNTNNVQKYEIEWVTYIIVIKE